MSPTLALKVLPQVGQRCADWITVGGFVSFCLQVFLFFSPFPPPLLKMWLWRYGWCSAMQIADAALPSPKLLGLGAAASRMSWECPRTLSSGLDGCVSLARLTKEEALGKSLIWHSACNVASQFELCLSQEYLHAWDFCKGQNLVIRDSLLPADA